MVTHSPAARGMLFAMFERRRWFWKYITYREKDTRIYTNGFDNAIRLCIDHLREKEKSK